MRTKIAAAFVAVVGLVLLWAPARAAQRGVEAQPVSFEMLDVTDSIVRLSATTIRPPNNPAPNYCYGTLETGVDSVSNRRRGADVNGWPHRAEPGDVVAPRLPAAQWVRRQR